MKKPRIVEETEKFIEVEIPEGKREEYDLKGFNKSGSGEDGKGNYFEYFIKDKPENNLVCNCGKKGVHTCKKLKIQAVAIINKDKKE